MLLYCMEHLRWSVLVGKQKHNVQKPSLIHGWDDWYLSSWLTNLDSAGIFGHLEQK